MSLPKQVIFNADDYGLCEAVNDAVEQLIKAQRLRSVSLLANAPNAMAAIQFLRFHSETDAGIHLNAVEGQPLSPSAELLTDENGSFVKLPELLKRWMLHPAAVSRAVEREWRAQIEIMLNAGLTLTHADSHQHVHGFPLAYRLTVKLCREYGISALRWPREKHSAPARWLSGLAFNASLLVAQTLTPTKGLRRNDHFLGFRHAGHYDRASLLRDLARMPAGVIEVALHPSVQANHPYPAYRGDLEFAALLDDEWPRALQSLGIEVIGWRDASPKCL